VPSRRRFIRSATRLGLALAAGSIISPAFATYQLTPFIAGQRRDETAKTLTFHHTHTGEKLDSVFYRDGFYDEEELARINHLLRDWRSGDVTEMDTDLLDLLFDVRMHFGVKAPFHIISGYRSPKTNAMLASRSAGVDKNSYHMKGQAIDIRIPGVRTAAIRDQAKKFERGGVGFYAPSDFVHVDTGPVRYW
jgi:uncharacterized protein YcbK (DUF882 family)